MKKQFVFAAAFLLALMVTTAHHVQAALPVHSGGSLKAYFKEGEEPMTLEVKLSQLDKKRTVVALQDLQGKEWLSVVVSKKDNWEKKLNFSGMPGGEYLLWITGSAGEQLQMLSLGNEGLRLYEPVSQHDLAGGTVLFTGTKKVGKTILRITPEAGKSIGLQMANLKEAPAQVTLYSVGAGPVLVQKIEGEQAYAKKFNFEGMSYGSYFLTVHTKEATICQFFTLSKDGLALGPLQRGPEKGGTAQN